MKLSVRIILVSTTHAGNIGGVARALKNMDFSELYLVNPCKYQTYEAYARASGANDIIDNAIVCGSLSEALTGCTLVFGTSARIRTMAREDSSVRQAVDSLNITHEKEKLAIVFGTERSGLSNDELDLCHRLIFIPANPEFSSLNLAAAVQLVVYELRIALDRDSVGFESTDECAAPVDDMERFYEHLQSTLIQLEFLNPDIPRLLMRRLRRLYNRCRPSKVELNILRGILAATEKNIRN